jgi:hypothetical protein
MRNLWALHLHDTFPHLSEAAARLLSAHATSCSVERHWSILGNIFAPSRNRLALQRARKLAFIRCNSKQPNVERKSDPLVTFNAHDLEDDEDSDIEVLGD